MFKRNNRRSRRISEIVEIGLSERASIAPELQNNETSKRFRLRILAGAGIVCLLGLGVMAKNGWLPHTDGLSGKKTGWFGKELPKSVANMWNPFSAPSPSPTPQLSKENIYAGSRLLAVEDANANAAPPADLAVWRPDDGHGNAYWYVLGGQGSAQTSFPYGSTGDAPVQADYDGDGKTDFSVFRPTEGIWYSNWSSDGSNHSASLGIAGDRQVAADYDGDGKTDIAIWHQSGLHWYFQITNSSTGTTSSYQYGSNGDIPVPADYDGDGKADIAVWRPSNHTFYYASSLTGLTQSVVLGATGDKPICADYDGDGKADFAVFTDSTGTWTILQSSNNQTVTVQYGQSGDTLVPNDYDGDGKVDLAVWRVNMTQKGYPGFWYIRQSHDLSTRTEIWGTAGDIPVPAFYRR